MNDTTAGGIITLKLGQKLRIGDDVTLEIVAIKGGKCRVGVTAPQDMPIDWDKKPAKEPK